MWRHARTTVFLTIIWAIGVPTGTGLADATPLAPIAALHVDISKLGSGFAPGSVGLSTEAAELNDSHLSVGHRPLVRLMRLLGPSVLRVGGNSVDLSWWTSRGEPPPQWATNVVTPADLYVLRRLLVDTGWRVLLGVDLGHFEPARAADEAGYAKNILGDNLLGFEIGNEPNKFSDEQINLRSWIYGPGEYLREADIYRREMTANAPGVAIYGPATGGHSWLTQLGTIGGMFNEITQHYYPINECPSVQPFNPRPTNRELTSPRVRQSEGSFLEQLTKTVRVTGRPTRIGETNSVSCNRKVDASPGFAGALWSLDWTLRAISSGVKGLNFHGELGICAYLESPICSSSGKEAGHTGDLTAQPEFYGLLAARQLEGGRFVKTSLTIPAQQSDITTWATVTPGGTVKIVIDNFTTSGDAQPISIPMSGYTATYESLEGPSAGGSNNITLGGSQVTRTGKWVPVPVRLHRVGEPIRVIVSPNSATIVTLAPWRFS